MIKIDSEGVEIYDCPHCENRQCVTSALKVIELRKYYYCHECSWSRFADDVEINEGELKEKNGPKNK